MSDFLGFIGRIEARGAHEAGICKVVPPKVWVPRKSGYSLNEMMMKIRRPLMQRFIPTATAGAYQNVSTARKPLAVKVRTDLSTVLQYLAVFWHGIPMPQTHWPFMSFCFQALYDLAMKDRYGTPKHSSDEDLEMQYWSSLMFVPPVDGCDVADTLSDDDIKAMNVGKLDSILRHSAEQVYVSFPIWKTNLC